MFERRLFFHVDWLLVGAVLLLCAIGVAMIYSTTYVTVPNGPGDLIIAGVFTIVPLALIAKQPDLGTAVTLIPVYLGVAYLAGLRLRLLAVFAIIAALMAPIAWHYALKDYQKQRIQTFLDPEQDPRGAGYQTIQARITVGSGGLTGKGFRQGTQGQYKFLPVAHND